MLGSLVGATVGLLLEGDVEGDKVDGLALGELVGVIVGKLLDGF